MEVDPSAARRLLNDNNQGRNMEDTTEEEDNNEEDVDMEENETEEKQDEEMEDNEGDEEGSDDIESVTNRVRKTRMGNRGRNIQADDEDDEKFEDARSQEDEVVGTEKVIDNLDVVHKDLE